MELPKIETEYLFYAEAKQQNDILINDAFQNELLISPNSGGFFKGEKLNGIIESIGAGYTLTRPSGRNDIQAKLLLRTDDGENILMSSEGILLLDQALEKRIIGGESVPPSDYYYRLHLSFDTGSLKYGWLNGKCCLAVAGIRDWSTICYDVYLIK
jgi:Protein of unknown function (DUF3237).